MRALKLRPWMWLLDGIEALDEPTPAVGRQRL